ncbi:MAG TPA: TadE family protein [Caulobacteraceae bacterium]
MKADYLRAQGANAAVEFALIVPVLFTLVLGIISGSALYFSQASMHMAAEAAARYWAVSDAGWSISSSCTFSAPVGTSGLTLPVGCTTAGAGYSTPAVYAKSRYFGAFVPTFTPSTGECTTAGGTLGGPGVIVAGSETFNFNAMFANLRIPLATTACYPLIE